MTLALLVICFLTAIGALAFVVGTTWWQRAISFVVLVALTVFVIVYMGGWDARVWGW